MTSQLSEQIERWPLDRLIPHARNARTHSDAQVAQIAGSIAEFGFVNAVLVGDDGVIVAGHGRVLAARKLGLSEVPVVVLAHLSPTQRRALMIVDNRIAENAGWDDEILAVGDAAHPIAPTGAPYRLSAFAALVSGAYAADVLVAQKSNRRLQPFSFATFGQGVAIGRGGVGFFSFPDDRQTLFILRGGIA